MNPHPTSNQNHQPGEPSKMSLLRYALGKIQWRKISVFLFVLSLISVIIATIVNNVNFILYSLFYFIVMLAFLAIDVFIEEYRTRKKSKDLLGIFLIGLMLCSCATSRQSGCPDPRRPPVAIMFSEANQLTA